MQRQQTNDPKSGGSPVPLINLIRACLDDSVLTGTEQISSNFVRVLDGWQAAGALVISQDFLNHRDDKLRAVVRAILWKRLNHFTSESFLVPSGSSDHLKADLWMAQNSAHEDVIIKPVTHSNRSFTVSVEQPRAIETNFDEISSLFQRCPLTSTNDSTTPRHLFIPTSLIFFVGRIEILRTNRLRSKTNEILIEMLLYWRCITSSEQQVATYLYDSEEWANSIVSNRQDKMFGDRKFHLVRQWWLLCKKKLEGTWGEEAVDGWLAPKVGDDLENWKRTECKGRFFRMIASLTKLLDEVDGKVKARIVDMPLPRALQPSREMIARRRELESGADTEQRPSYRSGRRILDTNKPKREQFWPNSRR